MSRDRSWVAVAVGAAIVVAHAAAFAALTRRAVGTELAVTVTGPPAAPTLAFGATLPPAIASRVAIDDDDGTPPGPGLHRRRWSVRYRGGFERAVGAAQLVGPFQDRAAPPCSGRVIVGQALLDDGHASAGTLAAVVAAALTAELRGDGYVGIGDFERVADVAVAWAELAAHADDRAMLGAAGAPHGYIRVRATIVFERVRVPIVVALIPTPAPSGDRLHVRVAVRAELAFDNRVAQWASSHVGGDRLATRLASEQLDGALLDTLAPPPPIELAGGTVLRFALCGEPPTIVDHAYAALPFAVVIGDGGAIRAPRIGRGPFPPVAADTRLALDLDTDALDAMLFELWRTGFLDAQLAAAGLDRKFDDDPDVRALLSLRISAPRLALPPVVVAVDDHLRLSAAARLAIDDAGAQTTGRVWGGLDFHFGGAVGSPAVDLGALELSCERSATVLVPCYGDLVAALRDRGAELHGALTTALARLLAVIFVERKLASDGLPAQLVIHNATPQLFTAPPTATLRLTLDAALAAP